MTQTMDRYTYIQGHLFSCLKAFETFDAIAYVKDSESGDEYVRITDRLGGRGHLKITNLSNDGVFREVARIVLNSSDASVRLPQTLVTNEPELYKIADLFDSRGAHYE